VDQLAKKYARRDRLLRLRRRINRRLQKLGVRDVLTANELRRRDALLQTLFFIPFLRRLGVRANHISYLGFILVTLFNVLMVMGYFKLAFLAGGLGILTDALDGPTARWKDPETGRDDVTGWGTFLDHSRDFFFAFSFGWEAFFRFGSISIIEAALACMVFLSYFLIMVAICIKYQILTPPFFAPVAVRFTAPYWRGIITRFSAFALRELQTDFWGRSQFLLLVVGVILLFAGKFMEVAPLIHAAYVILGGELAFGFRNIISAYRAEEDAEDE